MSVIVYTAILGASDSLKPAPTGADRCVCFVDRAENYADAKGWDLIEHTYAGDRRREAWRLRCLPHELFAAYDRVVWIDASFTLTNLPRLLKDAGAAPIAAIRHHRRTSYMQELNALVLVKQATHAQAEQQINAYDEAGFRPAHLSISCVIVRDRSDETQRFNETWEAQIRRYPGDNTQVSIDYSAWVNGLTIKALSGDRHVNPYATHDTRDHRRRRQPYPGQPVELNR